MWVACRGLCGGWLAGVAYVRARGVDGGSVLAAVELSLQCTSDAKKRLQSKRNT